MRDLINIVESQRSRLLYHWTTDKRAIGILTTNVIKQSRWRHFIESERSFFKGTSWSLDMNRWSTSDTSQTSIVIDSANLPNRGFSINGQRVYLQTMGMIKDNFDPTAYQFESEVPDEEFIVGQIPNFNNYVVRVITNSDTVLELCQSLNIPVVDK